MRFILTFFKFLFFYFLFITLIRLLFFLFGCFSRRKKKSANYRSQSAERKENSKKENIVDAEYKEIE